MIISRLGGITSDSDSSLPQAEKIEVLFEADGAISPGLVCIHDTGSTDGTLVIVAPSSSGANFDHRAVGIYEGKGGTGAATSTSGLSGNAAANGDIILVTTYGKAVAMCDGGAVDCDDGDALKCSTDDDGQLMSLGVTYDDGDVANFLYIDSDHTTTTDAAKAVFVKCM